MSAGSFPFSFPLYWHDEIMYGIANEKGLVARNTWDFSFSQPQWRACRVLNSLALRLLGQVLWISLSMSREKKSEKRLHYPKNPGSNDEDMRQPPLSWLRKWKKGVMSRSLLCCSQPKPSAIQSPKDQNIRSGLTTKSSPAPAHHPPHAGDRPRNGFRQWTFAGYENP